MRVAVFAPHPDDDVIGCGGTIAKHVMLGNEISIIYLTSGDAGSLELSKQELASLRERETKKAAGIFGVNDLLFFRMPDGYIEYTPQNLMALTSAIRQKKPDMAYIPHENDCHPDHKATYMLSVEAIRRAAGPWFQECGKNPWAVQSILAYEVWTPLQKISHIEDITDFMGLKLKALRAHKSQLKEIRYDEGIKGLNMYRGAMTGKGKYCECFDVMKAPLNLVGMLSRSG